jgi:hypothetical protein
MNPNYLKQVGFSSIHTTIPEVNEITIICGRLVFVTEIDDSVGNLSPDFVGIASGVPGLSLQVQELGCIKRLIHDQTTVMGINEVVNSMEVFQVIRRQGISTEIMGQTPALTHSVSCTCFSNPKGRFNFVPGFLFLGLCGSK